MKNVRRRWGRAVCLSACVLGVLLSAAGLRAASPPPAAAPAAEFSEVMATPQLLRQVQKGGYTLYLRHGPTNNAIPDRMPRVDLNDCSTQRPLTEAGRDLMAKVGAAMRQWRLPVGELHVSPMCRVRESALAAFPQLRAQPDPLLMYVSNFTAAEKAPVIAHTRELLSRAVPAGTNRLVLAHAPNLMELIGYFPKEGTLVVFKPRADGAGFDYLASVPPEAWPGLRK